MHVNTKRIAASWARSIQTGLKIWDLRFCTRYFFLMKMHNFPSFLSESQFPIWSTTTCIPLAKIRSLFHNRLFDSAVAFWGDIVLESSPRTSSFYKEEDFLFFVDYNKRTHLVLYDAMYDNIISMLKQEVDVGTCPFGLGSTAQATSHIKRYMRDSSLGSAVRPIR